MDSPKLLVYEGFCRDQIDRQILGDWYDDVEAGNLPASRACRPLPARCVLVYEDPTGFDDGEKWYDKKEDNYGVQYYDGRTHKTLAQHTTKQHARVCIATYYDPNDPLLIPSQNRSFLHELYGHFSHVDLLIGQAEVQTILHQLRDSESFKDLTQLVQVSERMAQQGNNLVARHTGAGNLGDKTSFPEVTAIWEMGGRLRQICHAVETGWGHHWLCDLVDDAIEGNDACMQGLRASLLV